jgi:myosin heavy subunit
MMVHVKEDEGEVDYSLNFVRMSTMDIVEKFKGHLEGVIELVENYREKLEIFRDDLEGKRAMVQEFREAKERLERELDKMKMEAEEKSEVDETELLEEIEKLKDLVEDQKGVIDNYEKMVIEEKLELNNNNIEYRQILEENENLAEENAKVIVQLTILEKEKKKILKENRKLSENLLKIEDELKSVTARGSDAFISTANYHSSKDMILEHSEYKSQNFQREIQNLKEKNRRLEAVNSDLELRISRLIMSCETLQDSEFSLQTIYPESPLKISKVVRNLKQRVKELEISVKNQENVKPKSRTKSRKKRRKSSFKPGVSTKKGFRKLRYEDNILKPRYRNTKKRSLPTEETTTSEKFYSLNQPNNKHSCYDHFQNLENQKSFENQNLVEKFKYAVGKVDEKITKIKKVLTESSN